MERHVQTVLLALITAAIGWLGKSFWDLSHSDTKKTEQIEQVVRNTEQIREDLKQIEMRFAEYMPRGEIEQRFQAVRDLSSEHSRRIEALEQRRIR